MTDRTTEPVGAFGRWLSQERELRGLERAEVARLTKLAPGVIVALESGDPARMPPKVYVCGYLRTYAAAVGLDPDDVVLRWQEASGPEETESPVRAAPARYPQGRGWLVVVIAVVLAVGLAVLLLGGSFRRAPLKLGNVRAVERAPYAPSGSSGR